MKELDAAEAERLVQTYSDLILRLSYTYLKSTHDGEDIVQTVLLKLLTGDEVFDSPEHEKAWVIRTAINACKDELRAFRRRAVPLDAAAEAAAPEPPRSDVLDAVMGLPGKYREAIYLWDGSYTYEDEYRVAGNKEYAELYTTPDGVEVAIEMDTSDTGKSVFWATLNGGHNSFDMGGTQMELDDLHDILDSLNLSALLEYTPEQ